MMDIGCIARLPLNRGVIQCQVSLLPLSSSCNRDFLILFCDATLQTGINKIELPLLICSVLHKTRRLRLQNMLKILLSTCAVKAQLKKQ